MREETTMGNTATTRRQSRATVLVVEDEGLIRMSVADCLRDNWDVLEAASGEEAKAMFAREPPIDVVFSDVQMSPACDGFALAHWIHENHPKVHVLLTSGAQAMHNIDAAVCAQASTFKKPYDYNAVVARIRDLLGP
jgi:DNA-binding NtrC family response regulator